MSTITTVNKQWASRPNDERFTSLSEMHDMMLRLKTNSRASVVANREVTIIPNGEDLLITRGNSAANINELAFSQIAQLAGAPAGYLRDLPAPIVADCINYGLKYNRDVEEVGLLVTRPDMDVPDMQLRAATGPRYGRIWNADIVHGLMRRFGDGRSGKFRIPGEFGKQVPITKQNTTLYAGTRDMFVFLADEENRVELPNRRGNKSGNFARGFFVWNSEVGTATLGAAFFLFDYVCMNRIIWGVEEFKEMRIRHTSGAPHRWVEEIDPILDEYRNGSAQPVIAAIESARDKKIADVNAFLADRFGARMSKILMERHEVEEGKPIETLWDAVTAGTSYARDMPNQDQRVAFERQAGDIMRLAA